VLTAQTPKPLLPVAGRPFLEHLIQEISRYGFQRVTLLAGRFGEMVRETYDGRALSGITVDVLVEPTAMGTGGALAYAAAQGRLEPVFLLMNGDSWIDMNLAEVVRHWTRARHASPDLLTQLLLQTVPDAARYGTVTVRDGKVTAFREKSPASTNKPGQINAGVYVIDRDAVVGIPVDRPTSLESDILPELVAKGCVTGILAPQSAFFIDIGLPETYEQAGKDLLRHRTKPALFLDRDGTLNVDQGYTHRVSDLVWQPDAKLAIKHANEAGYYVFVVTNQAGVARGYYSEADVIAFHRAMQEDLADIGAHVDAFEWCPHHVDGSVDAYRRACRRRKPQPGMIEDLIAVWPVDMASSLLIGDSEDDMLAASAAGLTGVRYSGGSLLDLVQKHVA
jgi:D-glycero-D-manno-heptose 1,7-bisphosphate phosphatase